MSLRYAAIVLAVLLPSADAVAWQTTLPGDQPDDARRLAIDARGDVVAAGWAGQLDVSTGGKVAKLHGGTGIPLWTSTFDTSPCTYAGLLALDLSGNAFVGASTEGRCDEYWPLPGLLTVLKLDGLRGAEQWRQMPLLGEVFDLAVAGADTVLVAGQGREDVSLPDGAVVLALDATTGAERCRWVREGAGAWAVAVDGGGDVIAAGWTLDMYGAIDLLVVKLAGVSGEPRWIRTLSGDYPYGAWDAAFAVEVDAAGDVVVGGYMSVLRDSHVEEGFTVLKLTGNDGQEIWRRTVPSIGPYSHIARVVALAVDRQGDVVASGVLDDFGAYDFMVAKFAGFDGTIRWTHRTVGECNQEGTGVAVDASGDVYAGGYTCTHAFAVLRFAGDTGAVRWHREVAAGDVRGRANDLALGPRGTVVAAGSLLDPVTSWDFAVVTFDGATGGAPSCDALCRLDGAAALLDAATAAEIDSQLADGLAHRIAHVSELLASPGRRRLHRGRRLLAGIVRAVERKLRSGRVAPDLGDRLLALLQPD